MSKQILYGTVSALALLLATQGAHAQSVSTTSTTGNTATSVRVDTGNEIEAFAFKRFTGALQVQQNASVNSVASQNMAIDAFKERNLGAGFFSVATSTNTVSGNHATGSTVTGSDIEGTDNSIEDGAFKHAKGAVQVQQNRAINSATGQNMDIDPESDRGGSAGGVTATASLTDTVSGNSATSSSVAGGNAITDGAFKHAKGAFEVQQNNSINSATQQNMALTAENVRGGFPGPVPVAQANLSQTVSGNNAVSVTVGGDNSIEDGAFKHAAGAFQVQQNNSVNSATGQNMAIAAFDSRSGYTGGGHDGHDDDAIATSTVTSNNAQGFPTTTSVDTDNTIHDGAFKHAKGAFQVQQSGSVNSAVGQNMAISAVKETAAQTDANVGAVATSTNTVGNNTGNPFSVVGSGVNEIDDGAFGHAKGAFQVQQNRSIASSTGQNMKVTAVSDPGGLVNSSARAAATLTSTVDNGINFITNDPGHAVSGDNLISDGAFKRAAGTFQVQQNNSENSSTQQNMAVLALKAKGGSVRSIAAASEADLTHTVSAGLAVSGVTGLNEIDRGAFEHAKGAFQVQQSSSGNSAVGQNMAITAVDAPRTDSPVSAATSPGAANSTISVRGNTAGDFFGTAFPTNVDVDNSLEDFAFKNARGAFQVQQNGSVNSSVSQNMAITAVKESGVPTDLNTSANATSTTNVTGNNGSNLTIDGGNTIEDFAFKNARGAFSVQQNQSINSSTSQNMKILAVRDPGARIISNFNSLGALNSTVGGADGAANTAVNDTIRTGNSIEDSAFKNARGAFQVQQNNSINSSTQQNMAITAVNARDPSLAIFGSDEVANLNNVVTGNTATNVTVTGFNQIDGHAFAHATGAFQVQQSNSTNSSVSQNMSIVAVSLTGRH